jgi:predicted Rossmann fold nucleotide-binding protein DprA/Smf involved in DNA uptake
LAERLTRAAVAGQYREALREERLALISPFDPDAGFNVGNAMARNKYIYTLSDWAIVANTAYQEGGTWAGATENLKAQWVPLFVRKDEHMPVGNQELLKQGAIAIDKKQLTDLRQQFSQLSETPLADDANKTKDLFEVVWPYIEQELVTEKTEKVLAERLNLHSTQLKIWLKRALELDKIKKLKKPVRYIINTDSQKKDEQETLFKS